MRHGKKINHLGRTASHRNAMLSNMASSLIMHKRIETTVAKAKALRKFVEPLLTKAKSDTTHSRRTVFSTLQNKESIKELFDSVAGKIANRPGGYTRIIKLSDSRLGDNAEMCIIELVDYNDAMLEAKAAGEAKTTTRRSRSKKKATDAAAPAATTAAPAAVVSEEAAAATDAPTETLKEGETRDEKSGEAAS
ncbi:LSU ribosomal protein L17P [Hymenobacter daecheongensis DSM 21074]|uniref:Large ribosomal subunit protein bL17 n=1 Tax=Hymenobacter daecheongensis DSM 21074 TaxID=1121955 RepID=A0A1M6DAC3_9BACT|nr:50S ribosomal protein L17 [Hymenobacter daecheongensis]SHI69998.1 LSU ribosomal protein L17P [Hymenobacter daecheongensis DSM 21074]